MWASRVSWAMSATGTWTESLRVSSPSFFLTSTRNPRIRWKSRAGPAPEGETEGEDDDHEEPEDDGPHFLVHRA